MLLLSTPRFARPGIVEDGEDGPQFGSCINRMEGDRTWSAPPKRSWHLRPPSLGPLISSSLMSNSTSTSLSRYCLESVAQQIERYEPASFSTVPDKTLESIWNYLEKRYREAAMMEEAKTQGQLAARPSEDLYLWLLKAQTQSLRAYQNPAEEETEQAVIKRTTQLVPVSELAAYLPTISPLTILQIRPTPDFTLLTTLTLSGYRVTDSTLLPLRHLTRLFFLFLISCPAISDAGIKSLAMSLDYKDIVLASTKERGDHELAEGRGCWRLRGIWLDGGPKITERAEADLAKWPFLHIISLRGTQSTTATFPIGSGWGRAIAADAAFLIPRIASRHGFHRSDPCVARKIRAYHRRWPGSMGCVKGETRTIGLVQVIGTGEVEEIILRQRPSARSFPPRNPQDTDGSSIIDETPAFDMTDRSTRFATDHGSASWLRTSPKAITSPRRGDEGDADLNSAQDLQYSADDLAQLYLRHLPTLYGVRKALLKAKGNLNPRSIVELEGKRPPSASSTTASEETRSQKPTWNPNTASPASSSPFSVNTSSADITVLRQKRQGRNTIMVPVPYSVPRSKLANRRPDVDEGWNIPETPTSPTSAAGMSYGSTGGTSYFQSKKRSAPSQPETGAPSSSPGSGVTVSTSERSLSQPRSKGMSMFKKLKR